MPQTNFRQWNEQPTELFDPKWETGMAVEFGFPTQTPEYGIIRLNMGSQLSICVCCGTGTDKRPQRAVHVIITPQVPIKELHDLSKLAKTLQEGCKIYYPTTENKATEEETLNVSHTLEKRIEIPM